ncbi:hypothetical protein, partial [Pseudoalteromonas sp. Z1A6]|uniref:hypothetical protein n=1 Tax=Pseudoalteromonas sp. Z1A6 TaxID=2686349 RepID=UPI00197D02B6
FIDKQTIAEFLFWFNLLLCFYAAYKEVFGIVLIGVLEGITEKFSVGTFFTLSRMSRIICTLFIFG